MADHQFRNTTVFVRDEAPNIWDPTTAIPATAHPANGRAPGAQVGNCVQYIMDHLEDIWNAPFGQQFFTDMANFGKRQVIKFIGIGVPNENACSNPGDSCKVRLRADYESGDSSAMRAELTYTLQRAAGTNPAHDMNWFASQVLTTQLDRWDPANTAPNSPLNPQGIAPGHAGFNGLRDLLVTQVRAYMKGTMSLTTSNSLHRELFDVMLVVLQPYLRNGTGGSSLIMFNPLKTATAAGYRPVQAALFHELVHAFYNAQGGQLSNEDSTTEAVGRYYELAAVGLPPFVNRNYHENRMRAHLGHALRTQY